MTEIDKRLLHHSLDRALRRALRKKQILSVEKFRCKEPLSEVLIAALHQHIPDLSDSNSFNTLLRFSEVIFEWISKHEVILDEYFGENALSSRTNLVNKIQPHFTETVLSTLLRYELITKYAKYVKNFNIGCILGGSLSYGKFFNLRQSSNGLWTDQSDVDLLLVADFDEFKNEEAQMGLRSTFAQISNKVEHDRELNLANPPIGAAAIIFGLFPLMQIGLQTIDDLKEKGELDHKRVILSKKYKINLDFEVGKIFDPDNVRFSFPLSVHFASKEAFNCLVNPIHPDEWDDGVLSSVKLIDIRIDSGVKDLMICHTMGAISVPESESKIIKKDENIVFGISQSQLLICELPAYFYWEDRFVAGMYQNVILPNFEILFDNVNKDLEKGVEDFKHFLRKESLREREIFKDSKNAISNLHPRTPILLTSVIESCNKIVERGITHNPTSIAGSYVNPTKLKQRKLFHQKYGNELNLESEIIREIRNHFGDQAKTKNVLELGCGSGEFLFKIKELGHRGEMVGVDIVPNRAKADPNSEITFITGDIQKLEEALNGKYYDKYFDIIVANHVLYHIPDVSSVLEHAVRYLNDNGIFIATTNSNHNLSFLSEIFREALAKNGIANFSDTRYSSYSAENASSIVREYFNFVKNSIFEIDISINEREDILTYIESSFDNYDVEDEPASRRKILDFINEALASSKKTIFPDRKILSVTTGKSPVRLDDVFVEIPIN